MQKLSENKPPARKVRENSVGWMLKRLSASLDAEMSSELSRLDLNLGEFAVLMTLSETEGLTQTEIGKKIAMPGYATTRTIDALEAKRFVERREDERSRRSYRIYLTDEGRKLVPELFILVKKVNEGLFSVLSATDKKRLGEILQRLVCERFK